MRKVTLVFEKFQEKRTFSSHIVIPDFLIKNLKSLYFIKCISYTKFIPHFNKTKKKVFDYNFAQFFRYSSELRIEISTNNKNTRNF